MTENMKIIKLLLIEKNMKFKDLVKISHCTTAWGLRQAINNNKNKTLIEELKKKNLQI